VDEAVAAGGGFQRESLLGSAMSRRLAGSGVYALTGDHRFGPLVAFRWRFGLGSTARPPPSGRALMPGGTDT